MATMIGRITITTTSKNSDITMGGENALIAYSHKYCNNADDYAYYGNDTSKSFL